MAENFEIVEPMIDFDQMNFEEKKYLSLKTY